LDAVFDEVRQARVDRVVVGGDVLPGPMFREAIARLREFEIPTVFIQGNCERAVLDVRAGIMPDLPESAHETIRWTSDALIPPYAEILASWPKTLLFEIQEIGTVLFCHGTPRHENELFTALTAEGRLLSIFEGLDVDLVVCGHTHMQFDRMVGTTRVVNAGSVGMPFGEAGADWLLLGPDVNLRHTSYDLAAAAESISHTDYPGAADFAKNYVLHPPSAAQMLEAFRHSELKYGPESV
jgi:predicted phosphodiesterase